MTSKDKPPTKPAVYPPLFCTPLLTKPTKPITASAAEAALATKH